MRVRTRFAMLVAFAACALAACSLNPQPFPPDNPDGSLSSDANPAFGDAGNIPDASVSDGPTGLNDDGGDADAAERDASDASDAGDGEVDADDGGSADATPGDAADGE